MTALQIATRRISLWPLAKFEQFHSQCHAGARARLDWQGVSVNPYPEGTDQSAAWLWGYRQVLEANS